MERLGALWPSPSRVTHTRVGRRACARLGRWRAASGCAWCARCVTPNLQPCNSNAIRRMAANTRRGCCAPSPRAGRDETLTMQLHYGVRCGPAARWNACLPNRSRQAASACCSSWRPGAESAVVASLQRHGTPNDSLSLPTSTCDRSARPPRPCLRAASSHGSFRTAPRRVMVTRINGGADGSVVSSASASTSCSRPPRSNERSFRRAARPLVVHQRAGQQDALLLAGRRGCHRRSASRATPMRSRHALARASSASS